MSGNQEKRNSKPVTLAELLQGSAAENRIAELSFEQGLKLVEELVAQVESGALPLDQAVLSYEKGVALVAHLRKLLAGAEERLRVLQETGGEIREEEINGAKS